MSPSQQNGWLFRVQHTLSVTDKVNRYLPKKMKEKWKAIEKKKSKSVKSVRYMDELFCRTNDFWLLKSCYLYIIAKYEASNCCKIEATIQRCSVKKVFLKIFQNSQKNPWTRVSFKIKLQLKVTASCEFCEIFKNTVFYRISPVAPSGKIRTKFLKWAKFQFQLLHLISWAPSTLWHNNCKRRYP